jgi:fructokinase
VTYHLSRCGVMVLPISAVGRDFLGDEIVRRIESWGVDSRFVGRLAGRGTGTVRARLESSGAARYAIAEHVAWDRIPISATLRRRRAPAAIVFGTLALRGGGNRRALADLLDAWPASLRVLDLNLRHPFDRGAGVAFALSRAQFVKLNDEELARMTRASVSTGPQIESAARRFAGRHRLPRVCVTAGQRGAGLLWANEWHWQRGRRVAVRDTIGAGDGFLAALLAALVVRQESPRRALATACRLGEFIATRDGATPPYWCDERGRPHEPISPT